MDPENVPSDMGGEWTCSHDERGCYFSHKGPWNDYPGDKFGEAAKQQVLELKEQEKEKEEQKRIEESEDSGSGEGASVRIEQESKDFVNTSMVQVDMEANKAGNMTRMDGESVEEEAAKKSKWCSFICCRKKREIEK